MIVLVDMFPRDRLFRAPPWMSLYLPGAAAALRADGHSLRFMELGAQIPARDDPARVAPGLVAEAAAGADIVLFEAHLNRWSLFVRCVEAARAAAPHARLVAGGRDMVLCGRDALDHCPALDAVVTGEVEPVLSALAGGADLADVDGLATRAAEPSAAQGTPYVEDLDSLPPPAWDLLDMQYHTRLTPRVIPCLPLRTATMQTSRGCGAHCVFCTEGRLHGRRHRRHSPGYVMQAVNDLRSRYGINGLYISDEDLFADADGVAALCEAFCEAGLHRSIQWSAQVRTDSVTPELLALAARAGCAQLELGIESGSQPVLDRLAKGTTVEGNEEALRKVRESGIRSLIYFMADIPDETPDDARQTLEFFLRVKPDIVRLSRFMLFPGTPLAERLIREGRLSRDFAWGDASWRTRSAPPGSLAGRAGAYRPFYFRHVLPLFARDYLRHNPPWAIFRDVRVASLPLFFARKWRGVGRA